MVVIVNQILLVSRLILSKVKIIHGPKPSLLWPLLPAGYRRRFLKKRSVYAGRSVYDRHSDRFLRRRRVCLTRVLRDISFLRN